MIGRYQPNEKIGDYRVVEFIGRGGMGEVYHLHHEKLGRSVAAKVLNDNVVADENYKERFLNEARLQASLHHPNVAQLYDFQQIGNELLIFMEFVDGECLDSLIERRHFSTGESLQIFEAVVSTIRYVHANGIIHRDIKAENVKINSAGVPKLLDFGIAKDPSSRSLTRAGGVIGTPNYLAPEQVEGGDSSQQTDIWALGVLLYKMLTGRLPFDGERVESLVVQIAQGRYPAPESLNPAVPKSVSSIVGKCLARNLSERYGTAEELLRDVRAVLNERYSSETAIGAYSRGRLLPSATIWPAVGSVLVLLGVIATAIWATGEAGASPEPATPARVSDRPVRTNEDRTENSRAVTPPSRPERATRTVRIDSIGGRAEVWRNGQKIGTTPLDLEVAEKENVSLKLRRPGFEDTDAEFEASAGKKVYTFALRAK